jgi:Domain of unknown function (DUF4270)
MKRIFFVLFASIFIFACNKSSDIGGNILPTDDFLNSQFTDTATVLTKTVYDEALRTDKMSVSHLGCLNDANLGRSNASLVAELYRPLGVPLDTAGPFTLDSAVLYIKYAAYYGDTSVPQTFTVNILNNKINESSTYLSDESGFTGVSEIGRLDNYRFSPLQKIYTSPTDTSGTNGLIRIPISSSFANSILSMIGDTTLKDSTAFKNFLPGIIIQNEGTSGNCMVQVSLTDTKSRLVLFFKDADNELNEMYLPASQIAIINASLAVQFNSINLYAKDYSGTNVPAAIASSEASDSVTYALGQAGLLTKVSLPNLLNFGRVAVNKAILEVTQYVPNNPASQTPPVSMYLSRKNSSGEFASLINYGIISFATIDSSVAKDGGGKYYKYLFNITGHVQDVLFSRDSNTDIYINTHLHADKTTATNPLSSFGYTPAGIVLGGGNGSDPNVKAKLKLTYSPVK